MKRQHPGRRARSRCWSPAAPSRAPAARSSRLPVLRPRVAGQDAGADRLGRRRAAGRRPRLGAGGGERGKPLGLGLAAGARPAGPRGGAARGLDALRAAREGAAGRHAHAAAARSVDDQRDGPDGRLRHVRLVPARAAARADAGRGGLRLRRERHPGRPVPAALVGGDAVRRPVLEPSRRALRLAQPRPHRHRADRSASSSSACSTTSTGTSISTASSRAPASASRSPRWRR